MYIYIYISVYISLSIYIYIYMLGNACATRPTGIFCNYSRFPKVLLIIMRYIQ